MLALSRRTGEEILISDNIRLVVIRIIGDRVVLGIEAPKDVLILRKELADRKKAESLLDLDDVDLPPRFLEADIGGES